MSKPEVSWKALEPGADVVGSDGESIGTLSRVVGDAEADVFTGLAVKASLLSGERLVPSERVRGIWPDRIEIDLSKSDVENLPPYEDSPVVRWTPDENTGFFSRLFRR
jgi:sporulation protein YlmC with PRC-barrel domain